MDAFFTVQHESRDEFIVSRSRFIGWAKPVGAEEDALLFINKIRKDNGDATHNAWAYSFGDARERYSDDGEPQGTAGLPILEVIRKEKLRNTAIVVTRYFGGVKLGAGGLVRAYTKGAKIALDAGVIIEQRPYLSFDISAGYPLTGKLQRALGDRGYMIKGTAYLEQVTHTVLIPPDEKESLETLIAEITAGQGRLALADEEYLAFPRD